MEPETIKAQINEIFLKIVDQINKVKEKIMSNIDTQLKFVNLSEMEKLFI